LAQMGRGMVQDVGDQMFQVFSQRMRAELETAPPRAAGPAAPALPAPAKAEALDMGAMGARAALRAPVFWIGIALIAGLLWLLFR
ncbi:MAG TPA: hypothetical protein VMK66_06450, partial [Myxococcales bacterium]|nr:hypothetical protein [Myxococcales bacterium]